MVEENQPFHASPPGRRNGIFDGGMSPPQPGRFILLLKILGVIDQEIGPGEELFQAAVFPVGDDLALMGGSRRRYKENWKPQRRDCETVRYHTQYRRSGRDARSDNRGTKGDGSDTGW